MKIANCFTDYEIIATGDGEKLERWGEYYLLRPDPQVIWHSKFDLKSFDKLHAHYIRSSTGGGFWDYKKPIKDEWVIAYKDLKFLIKPMGFKHTGLFPEQSYNWDVMQKLVKEAKREINVLNLFAYTGGASVALASVGAKVTHVDAAKGMIERAKENATLNGLTNIRFIQDDCKKFIERELRRGKRYDAIIMDPPSYGRGPNGEMWKIEDSLFDFVKLSTSLLSNNPLFILINSYTTGLQPAVLNNILKLVVKGNVESYELVLPTDEGIVLPCGASGLVTF